MNHLTNISPKESIMTSEIENEQIKVGRYLRELKSSISLWENIVLKSEKLVYNSKLANQSVNNVIDCASLLCTSRRHNFTGLNRIDQLLSEISVTEKYLADKMEKINKAVHDNLVVNLSQKIESFRNSVITIKKEKDIKGRKAKIVYKKSLDEVVKLEKKINKHSDRKQSLSDTMSVQIHYANQDLQNKERFVDELDRCALRKAICEERDRYRLFVDFLRPVLEAQLAVREDLDQLQRIYDELYSTPIFDLNAVPLDVETYVHQYHTSDRSRSNSISSSYSHANSHLSLTSSIRSKSAVDSSVYSLSTPQHSQENLDTSSSTLLNRQNKSSVQDEKLWNEKELKKNCDTENNETFIDETTTYSVPRYSNLRQLKQNKKYCIGTSISRNTFPSNNENQALSQNTTPYNNPGKTSPFVSTSNCNESNVSATTHRNNDHPTDHHPQDSDIYSSISQIYGTPFLCPELTSGTSTFKRRKPSNITAMEAPKITDKKFYQQTTSKNPNQNHEDDFMDILRIETSGDNSNFSQSRYSADFSNLNGKCLLIDTTKSKIMHCRHSMDRISSHTEFSSGSNNDITIRRGQQIRKITKSVDQKHELTETLDPEEKSGEIIPFKQQLLQVILTGRPPYHKPMSPVSSHIF